MKLFNPFGRKKEERSSLTDLGIPPYPGYRAINGTPVVSQETALSLTAFHRCVQLIADQVASLPLHAQKDGERLEKSPSLVQKPNPFESRQETIFAIVASLLMHGNAICILGGFDRLQYPTVLYPVDPTQVAFRMVDGELFYKINGVLYSRSDVLHIKGFTLPGHPLGMGVIQTQTNALSHGLALHDYAARHFSESAVPPGIITFSDEVTAEEAKQFKREWVSVHGGGSREPAVLTAGATFKEYNLTPEVSQFIESRKFSAAEICNMFGVPQSFLGVPGDTRTYSNVEQESLNFLKWCLSPWLVRIENAFSELLPRGTEAKFNVDALLRTDTKTRYEAHAIGLSSKFLTVNEVRALENRTPLPGGDEIAKPEPVVEVQKEEDTEDGDE